MEEQPIDDLFRRKLHDTEIVPSSTAWATLQSRQGKLRVIPLWTYMAVVAASLVLIGSFGWWTFLPQSEVKSQTLAAKSVKSPSEMVAPRREERLTKVDKAQIAQQPRSGQKLSVRQSKKEVFNRRDNISREGIMKNRAMVAQQPTLRTSKAAEAQSGLGEELVEYVPTKSVMRDIRNEIPLVSAERTLVVSIAQPTLGVSRSITSGIGTMSDSTSRKSVLSSLLRKVKKLKDGEVFALSADGSGRAPRRGLGKVYEEVKESIKNNSAD